MLHAAIYLQYVLQRNCKTSWKKIVACNGSFKEKEKSLFDVTEEQKTNQGSRPDNSSVEMKIKMLLQLRLT